MATSLPVPNQYGMLVPSCLGLAVAAIVVGGAGSLALPGVFVGVAVLSAACAMYRTGSDADSASYPHDQDADTSKREHRRRTELEGKKAEASGNTL